MTLLENIKTEEIDIEGWAEGLASMLPYKTIASILTVQLAGTDWLMSRHQEQTLAETETSLTQEEFTFVVKNRNTLREQIGVYQNPPNNPVDE